MIKLTEEEITRERFRREDRRDSFPAAILSVAVHGALFAGLFTVFQWNTAPETVYAELWAPEDVSGGNDPSGVAEKLPEETGRDEADAPEKKAAEPEPEPEPEEPASPFTTVDASYFDDALFIGDSHTDGFKDYAGLPNADYLCHNGLTVWSAVEKAEFPGRQTLSQALRGKHYGKIYLMLGINELGAGTAESWAAQYKVLLDEVRELQPDAIIFLQAIFHTTQEKSDATFFKNSTIDARNAELQKLADNETVFYIDCNPVFDDSTGALTAEYSGDGVHVKAPYYVMWRDYLFQFGVVR